VRDTSVVVSDPLDTLDEAAAGEDDALIAAWLAALADGEEARDDRPRPQPPLTR
jgi:hypothetical protein